MKNQNRNEKYDLICPKCHSKTEFYSSLIICTNKICGTQYPIIDNIPILINEEKSVFRISTFLNKKNTFFIKNQSIFNKLKNNFLPSITLNIRSKNNYLLLSKILKDKNNARVLVIGGSITGNGFEILINNNFSITNTDVSFGPNTDIICDAHDIPFPDNYFDCVISQAVLEHVIDPYRVSSEIFRILKIKGIVYAETPFMQQVHGRQYDFTRFTNLGHRRLFRKFNEISSGVLIGPATSFLWSLKYFMLSLSDNKVLRKIFGNIVHLLFFWIKYFDLFLLSKESAFDDASAFFFIGEKSSNDLDDKTLINLYKGGF